MTTALRPIVGTSDRFLPAPQDKKFFVGYWLESIQAETQGEVQGASARRD
jgi:hypothetical protein